MQTFSLKEIAALEDIMSPDSQIIASQKFGTEQPHLSSIFGSAIRVSIQDGSRLELARMSVILINTMYHLMSLKIEELESKLTILTEMLGKQ